MPTWGEILKELQELQKPEGVKRLPPGVSPFDFVRRNYLQLLYKHTKRNAILYASKWTQGGVEPGVINISPEDVQGFMEVIHGLSGDSLDLILHSPGGSAEATESLVVYLRSKFKDIRIIIPHSAMSAASIHSFIGPIDPQFVIQTELGRASVPSHAILEQFKQAKEECRDPALLPSWLPMLRQYGPALIIQCQLAQELSQSLVATWLSQYMFVDREDRQAKAEKIAKALSDHARFKSHERFISRNQAKELGLIIDNLEEDQTLQDITLSIFHSTTHTFNVTPAVKLIENHLGKAFIKIGQQVVLMQQPPVGPPGRIPPPP